MISAAKFDTCGKKGGNEVEDGMILGAGTGVFNLTSFSGLPTDSIIPSLDEAGVFFSFSYTTTFLASSITSSSSDTPPHLPNPFNLLPWEDHSYYLPKCLPIDSIDSLAYAFMISRIKLEHCCLNCSSSSLVVMFW